MDTFSHGLKPLYIPPNLVIISHKKMKTAKMPFAFFSFIFFTLAHLSLAQNSPKDFLAAHNSERAKLGLKPFTWNQTVAQFAQTYANIRSADCNLQHSQTPNYGENIAEGSGDLSGADAVKLWLGEKPYYDYKSNACVGGEQCGHYTQAVWRKTEQIGCARVRCKTGWWFITCNYYPPGNYIGERPY